MSNRPGPLATIEYDLNRSEIHLLKQRGDVRQLIQSKHKAKDTIEMQKQVADSEEALDELLSLITKHRNISAEFKNQAEELCKRCQSLNGYIQDMRQALSNDWMECRYIENERRRDAAKDIACLFTPIVGLVTLVNDGVAKGYVSVGEASVAGLAIGIPIVFRREIATAFENAKKNSQCSEASRKRNKRRLLQPTFDG